MKKTILPESFIYLLLISIIYIALELATGGNYPIFRDEFYYLDCANHLSWGFVDHPPFSILILFLWKTVFGTSLLSIRILPALSGGILILLTGFITKELGGHKNSQIFSAIAVFAVPTFLVTGSFYSMNSFDILFWAVLFYILIKIINTKNPKLWLWFGIVAGLGLMNKISIAYFGAGVAAAMLCTKERNWFKNKFFWIGGALALLIFSPYIIWNVQNDFATLEFIQNATKYKIADISAVDFFKEQILQTNPFNFVIWFIGIIALFFSENLKKNRIISIAYIFIFIILAVQKSKPYYLAAAYPVLISAGSVAVSEFMMRKQIKFILPVYASLTVILIAVFSPILIPLLPPASLDSYMEKIYYKPNTGEKTTSALPQYLADRFGWEEMAKEFARVYNTLSDEEKKKTVISVGNYGEASSLNYFAKKYGLPRVLCAHNNHWIWGKEEGFEGIDIILILGGTREDHLDHSEDVTEAGEIQNPYCMPYENGRKIFIARHLKPGIDLKEVWKKEKNFI